jgi:hypothetical protein
MIFVNDIPSPKLHIGTNLVPVLEKFPGMFGLELEIMRVRMGSETNFFQLNVMGFFSGFLVLLLLLVPELAIIHDLADRWLGVRRDFDEIQFSLLGKLKGVGNFVYAMSASGVNDANGVRTDLIVYSNSILCDGSKGLICMIWSI